MHYQTLLGECADRILTVTLNRPAKLNAMSATMLAELRAVFSAAATDPAVSVVVLRASGRAFTVGSDLTEADWLISQYPAHFDGTVDHDRARQDILGLVGALVQPRNIPNPNSAQGPGG